MSIKNATDSATRMTTNVLSDSDRNRSKRDLGLAGGSFILICTSLQHYSAAIHKATVASIQPGAMRTIPSLPEGRRPSLASLHSKP
jgi:hypothetical protein